MKAKKLLGIAMALAGALIVLALPSAAAARDRNHDRIPDRWEKRHHLSLRVNQAQRDQDRDHLRNRAEFLAGDDPRDPDSDNDGTMDGDENAGRVQSFDASSGRLVIDLFGGDTLSGLVTDQTEIECDDEGEDNSADVSSEDRRGGSEVGDGSSSDDAAEQGESVDEANCTTASLTPGAVVKEAELQTEGGSAVFENVELAD
jgi:hypothetical protein